MSRYFLTRRAASDLRNIHRYSIDQWGKKRADKYVDDIVKTLQKTAKKPARGELRKYRSLPFLMVPAAEHFVIYQALKKGIVVATVLHGRRNIEAIIRDMAPALETEINEIENNNNSDPGSKSVNAGGERAG
ncbi:hypothetical protein MNBD_GAMMA26-241 [hydrothermal vent metagenome]|uniref:Death on curing protein, Doc toxin n=1 Tax=hydrothermal vent metagenome TaxID=652676 RepID=A0A3B1BPB7_9ZZZZ